MYWANSRPRGRGGRGRQFPSSGRNRSLSANWRQPPQSHKPSLSKPPPSSLQNHCDLQNPRDQYGNLTTCDVCGSWKHWAPECPYLKQPAPTTNSTYFTPEVLAEEVDEQLDTAMPEYEEIKIILAETELQKAQHLDTLVHESTGSAVLDCGASKTCTSQIWWNMFYGSLTPELKKDCRFSASNRHFKFGDGKIYKSLVTVNFPVS